MPLPTLLLPLTAALHRCSTVSSLYVPLGCLGSLRVFDNGFTGGVHTATTPSEARHIASQMLGHRLVTKQSGSDGKPCHSVMVSKRYTVEAEKYLCLLLDRHSEAPVFLSSPAGGVDIEDTLHHTPDLVHKQPVDATRGPTEDELGKVAATLGLPDDPQLHHQARMLLRRMYDMFVSCDALQIEINPLAVTSSSTAASALLPLDLKVEIDDNAAFRQPQLAQQRDWSQLDSREAQANQRGLSFVALSGDIGSIVNGAGLSLATMDLIHQHGGRPANFLDLGGASSQQHMELALQLLSNDPTVRVILINIFGGILRCDVIALGLLAYLHRRVSRAKPVVVRLEGTNVEEAMRLLEESGWRVAGVRDLDAAAFRAVRVADIVQLAESADIAVSFDLGL